MIKGFGLHNFSADKYNYKKYQSPEKVKESIESILSQIGYEKGFPINFDRKEKTSDIYAYESLGEGGCTVRYANDLNSEKKSNCFYCYDEKGRNHLVGAILIFIGPSGSLIQRTKEGLKKADFPYFEI